jgi:Transposase DDE domain
LRRPARHRGGRTVRPVFDRGYASARWLGALRGFATRFTRRWKHQYPVQEAHGQQKAAWRIALGKRAWDSRRLRDAVRGTCFTARVLAFPVFHPDHGEWPLWLVGARRSDGKPWYLLSSERVETAEQAGSIVFASVRRWQIELVFNHCKSDLGFQSPRVWEGEGRLKLLGLATLAYAFLLHLLSEQYALLRRWLIRYACRRTGTHLRLVRVPLARLRSALSQLCLAHPPAFSRRAARRL